MPSQAKHYSRISAGIATLILGLSMLGCDTSSNSMVEESTNATHRALKKAQPDQQAKLVVYSSRNEQLIQPLFSQYTEQTGVEIEFKTDKAGALIQRLKAEQDRTPADLLLTVDAGNLWFAKQQDLLQTIQSDLIDSSVPSYLRDPEDYWTALSVRARTIVYHPDRVEASDLSSYEALAQPKWKGKLCLRTSKKVYNQSMVAMMIASNGEQATEQVVTGWVNNLAAEPFSSDTKLIDAIAAGQCDVGIVNTYYLGRLIAKDPNYPVALHWAGQQSEGVHVNISGIAITKHSENVKAATRFIEWLASGDAQQTFASVNLEFPLAENTQVNPIVAAWGSYKPQLINVSKAGELQADAVRLMDRAGYR